jgi:hypothetical protein
MTNERHTLPLRAASIWLALAVALLSSLMSSGLPRTTSLGSAFNPATTAVALQPTRAQPRALIEHVRRDDGPASGQGAAISTSLLTVQPAVRPATAAEAPKPAAALRPIAPHAGLDGSPRGPPSA